MAKEKNYPGYYVFMGHANHLPAKVKRKILEVLTDREELKKMPIIRHEPFLSKAKRVIVVNKATGDSRIIYLKNIKRGRYTIYIPLGDGKLAVLSLED